MMGERLSSTVPLRGEKVKLLCLLDHETVMGKQNQKVTWID